MQRKRAELVPIGKRWVNLGGPGKALCDTVQVRHHTSPESIRSTARSGHVVR